MLDWFKIKSMKINPGKFQFMVLGVKNIAPFRLNINGKIIPCSSEVKFLGIITDKGRRKCIQHFIQHFLLMLDNGAIIRTGTTCKKIPCYM